MEFNKDLKLVISIVRAEHTEEVITALEKAGAAGWSIVRGRGASSRSQLKVFGMRLEPMKEVIYTIVPDTHAVQVMQTACEVGQLNEPGNGISFIVNVEAAAGVLFG
ncbi:P-II family nitrogen regulator [Desulfurispirillum indicum]|uniref:Nitrogen regulatory protein P-II n=1 Tax=Desulfurispirillum indicum (strain ATCC BAA-1389 / DSM 22839 / S5) TaxID=653733 RepID=E6W3Z7_DESIS|nr:P-II family nitrogen regulator [Desulfurispirillum indicum]ADU65865.1 nitrogen regulatory protein P-II [Desulfurispirillum indicum S5]UCZ57801.1 P-II family nitrogen regulator [Desulfurispirillum indicum]